MIAYPWAGETPRPRFDCDWHDFLRAYAAVVARTPDYYAALGIDPKAQPLSPEEGLRL